VLALDPLPTLESHLPKEWLNVCHIAPQHYQTSFPEVTFGTPLDVNDFENILLMNATLHNNLFDNYGINPAYFERRKEGTVVVLESLVTCSSLSSEAAEYVKMLLKLPIRLAHASESLANRRLVFLALREEWCKLRSDVRWSVKNDKHIGGFITKVPECRDGPTNPCCPVCETAVGASEQAVLCDGCWHWCHAGCLVISDGDYVRLKSLNPFTWSCPKCDPSNSEAILQQILADPLPTKRQKAGTTLPVSPSAPLPPQPQY
jgi:hypothetical protein